MVVALLIAGAALAHATWNVTVKKTGASGPGYIWAGIVVSAIVYAPFGVTSLLDAGASASVWLPLALVSGALQIVYFFVLQRAYRVGDVSIVYPLARGTGPAIAVLLAIIVLGERPGPVGLLGAAVVVAGVMVVGFAGGVSQARGNRAGILYGLAVGVIIAVYTLWDAAAVTVHELPPVGYYWASVVVQLVLLAVPALRSGRATVRVVREHPIAVVIFGVLGPLAYILVLFAVQVAPVSIVAPAREISVVLVGLAGWLLFREPHPVQRLIGAVIVVAGVALLALA
ncbi:drug/metabolite transporter (DMT)-like permease [Microbacteriaceae bacterium SG_E_30_P1]|uniref:Drug/metabolite transporter (DMT)-like permease n=1 Tax=Antiquaquibacter oligotrophicus TaxID=2880260 RepID=A0ABT6KN16_9MICO|nr:DMT family transporter [Antiquaquibacter oligotrophicus]MDH6181402.1 drug/metabolite transporter (DMT)-like permease [Antiquaquibacter oligotrophicus]UDF12906.1 DMT family transporter [Antiquaquibacter oligotrophicus]